MHADVRTLVRVGAGQARRHRLPGFGHGGQFDVGHQRLADVRLQRRLAQFGRLDTDTARHAEADCSEEAESWHRNQVT